MEKEKGLKPADVQIQLPPGFRFHPSDEELIVHYLRKKTTNHPLPAAIFTEVELYKFNPWDLPMKASFGEEEWYFFSPRDRKYPNGMRPNRMASSGYWKATGIDKPILSSCGSKVIGVKKALVFYVGRPPKGNKTDWIMHEYRLPEATWNLKKEKTMRLDDWVLCRVRQKTGIPGQYLEDRNGVSKEPAQAYTKLDKKCTMGLGATTAPMANMFREYLHRDYPTLPFLLGFQNPCMDDAAVSTISFEGNKISTEIHCTDTTTTAVSKFQTHQQETSPQGGYTPILCKQRKCHWRRLLQSKPSGQKYLRLDFGSVGVYEYADVSRCIQLGPHVIAPKWIGEESNINDTSISCHLQPSSKRQTPEE